MYTPEQNVETFIVDYMNASQAEALLEIARIEHPAAEAARLVGITGQYFELSLTHDGVETHWAIGWPSPLTRREDIREHLQTLEQEARFTHLRRRAIPEADRGWDAGRRADATGQAFAEWTDLTSLLPNSSGWMHSGVAVTTDGTVHCAHPEGGALLSIPRDASIRITETDFAELHGIATTSQARVLAIADPGYRMVGDAHGRYEENWTPGRAGLIDSETGATLLELDDPSAGASGPHWRPTSIAEAPDGSGDIWVADGYGLSWVHRFDRGGRLISSHDGAATGTPFDCPHGIMLRAADHELEVLIADRANHRIVVLDTEGTLLEVFGTDHLDSPSAMTELNGDLFVTELHGGIARFDPEHRFLGSLEPHRPRSEQEPSWPNQPGCTADSLRAPRLVSGFFNSPHGITAHDGHLYFTEWLIGGRLIRLAPR